MRKPRLRSTLDIAYDAAAWCRYRIPALLARHSFAFTVIGECVGLLAICLIALGIILGGMALELGPL